MPLSDEQASQATLYRPPQDNPEMQYLHARRKELGGYLPARVVRCPSLAAPPAGVYPALCPGQQCIRDVLDSAPLPESIQLRMDCPPSLPAALADRDQVRIVFANLIHNALEAMPNRPARRHAGIDLHRLVDAFRLEQVFRNIFENSLAACPDPVEITVTCSAASPEGQPALRIAVRDNGPGLNPEQRQHIFEPFFTTKTKGTGLGMAIAEGILEAHGGQITVGTPLH